MNVFENSKGDCRTFKHCIFAQAAQKAPKKHFSHYDGLTQNYPQTKKSFRHPPKGPHEKKRPLRAPPVIAAVLILLSSLFRQPFPRAHTGKRPDLPGERSSGAYNRLDYCQNRLRITGDFAAGRKKHPAENQLPAGRTSAQTTIKNTPEQNGYIAAAKRAACPFIIPVCALFLRPDPLKLRTRARQNGGRSKNHRFTTGSSIGSAKEGYSQERSKRSPMQGRLSFAVLERPGRVNYSRLGRSFLHTSPRISDNTQVSPPLLMLYCIYRSCQAMSP